MKLTIDIGNTQIKIGVFDGQKLIDTICFNDNNDIYAKLESIKKNNPTISIISSVVPKLTPKYKDAIFKIFGIDSFIINHQNVNYYSFKLKNCLSYKRLVCLDKFLSL